MVSEARSHVALDWVAGKGPVDLLRCVCSLCMCGILAIATNGISIEIVVEVVVLGSIEFLGINY